ncbi:hypothetical protein U1Q18_049388 [Sarracenia purpurea var. burkii]
MRNSPNEPPSTWPAASSTLDRVLSFSRSSRRYAKGRSSMEFTSSRAPSSQRPFCCQSPTQTRRRPLISAYRIPKPGLPWLDKVELEWRIATVLRYVVASVYANVGRGRDRVVYESTRCTIYRNTSAIPSTLTDKEGLGWARMLQQCCVPSSAPLCSYLCTYSLSAPQEMPSPLTLQYIFTLR